MAPPAITFDMENGLASEEEKRRHLHPEPNFQGNEEYINLVKYISTYRDGRRRSSVAVSADGDIIDETPKKPWWAFWRKSKKTGEENTFEVPDEWLLTDIRQGLRPNDVDIRRRRAGYNELSTEKENMILICRLVMELAVILAAGLQDWIDFAVIIAILLLNAGVGWYQEKQAADVVASLRGDIALRATVVRDGTEQDIKAREIVPGDIIVVEEGQVIPADARLICAYENPDAFSEYRDMHLEEEDEPKDKKADEDAEDDEPRHHGTTIVACDQSAITGESLAVDKYMGDVLVILYDASAPTYTYLQGRTQLTWNSGCKRGKAYAIVTASARYSFVGRTASLVQGAKDQGHFKAIMNSIGSGTALLVVVVLWILISWIGGFYHHLKLATPMDSSNNLLHYVLILLIVGVPVGLPVVTTTTLAVGAAYLAKEKAIVQKLTAIESLAGVDVLCSDKTGTLTANQLSIRDPYVAEGVDVNWMMAVAALASSHNIKSLDPIDKVTILTLKRYPKAREILEEGWKTEKFLPFDPVSKRITAICTLKGVRYTCAKGAPKAILNISNCSKETSDLFKNKASEFARRGFRSLGVAVKKDDEDWHLLGMLSMFDPPREDTAQTIAEAQFLGLQVKMLTGDALAIAKETCKMLALGTKVFNSERLIHGGLSGTTQHDLVERADGFAEVFPEHKYQVVEMLQQRGHLTAMTGDGVNDAPSLKKSDCGIAVEGASEAAQAAADIVFLAPGLSTIVSAIKIARQIFQRMKAYIQYRIALCLHLEIYLVTSMCIINETLRVDLVVFLALFADLATIAVAYDNAHFEARPVEWQLPKIWIISVTLGALLALATWVIRASLFLPNGGFIQNFGNPQEILFLQISLTENWLIFVTRGGQTWPSWQLVGAILGVDVIATLFCVFGWLSGPSYETTPRDRANFQDNGRTSIVTALVIWGYSIAVTIVIAIVYFLMNRISWLDNLGRKSRSRSDTNIENIISSLVRFPYLILQIPLRQGELTGIYMLILDSKSKISIQHEVDANGGEKYYLAPKATDAEMDE